MTAAGVLHMRIRGGRKRYRFWSSVVDAYVTDECSETQALNYIKHEAMKRAEEDAKRALERANTTGSSSYRLAGDPVIDMNGPWRQEICPKHNTFHHTFKPGAFLAKVGVPSRCQACGEEESHKAHLTPGKGCR